MLVILNDTDVGDIWEGVRIKVGIRVLGVMLEGCEFYFIRFMIFINDSF